MRPLTKLLSALALFGTTIVAFLGLWQWWDAPKADLQATVSVSEFLLPPDVAQNVAIAQNAKLGGGLQALMKRFPSAAPSSAASTEKAEADENQVLSLAQLYGQMFSPANDLNGMVQVVVKNTGDAPSKNVRLRLPSPAFYILVESEAGDYSSFNREQTLLLGDLRKAEKATVWYWDRSLGGSMDFSKIQEGMFVTDDNAAGSVTIVAPMAYDEFKSQLRLERIFYSMIGAMGLFFSIGIIGAANTARKIAAQRRSIAGQISSKGDSSA